MLCSNDTWRSTILFGFRAAVIAQTLSVVSQAPLAGLALSGHSAALKAHMVFGGFAMLASAVQMACALPLRNVLRHWMVLASAGLVIGEGLQMASGRLHLFALHLPLGLALFAGLTVSSLSALNAVRICDCPPREVRPSRWSARSLIGGES